MSCEQAEREAVDALNEQEAKRAHLNEWYDEPGEKSLTDGVQHREAFEAALRRREETYWTHFEARQHHRP
jgi:hypothetical protein